MNKFLNSQWLGLAALIIMAAAAVVIIPIHLKSPEIAPRGEQNSEQILGSAAPAEVRDQPVEKPQIQPPTLIKPLELGNVKARSYLVFDTHSGINLAEQNIDYALPVASLTKLMTGYVAYQNLNLRDSMTITTADTENTSPTLGLRPGDEVVLQDLFNSMLVGSANDASKALANHTSRTSGKPFIALMNDAAKYLEMDDTHFSNPIGFDSDRNYSTAADLKQLIQELRQYQAFSLYGRHTSYSFISKKGNTYSVRATNKLLRDKDITAIKTGFTNEAQGAMIVEINNQKQSFVIILLNSPERENDTTRIKQAILGSYQWP
jgi:serine-type D-Ala-D-Ala carboxypeptidase (penicillin-binding protein 5/6)